MTANGVSKKLCITAAGIVAVTQLAGGAVNKWPYAVLVCVMCVVFKIVQGWIDSRKG